QSAPHCVFVSLGLFFGPRFKELPRGGTNPPVTHVKGGGRGGGGATVTPYWAHSQRRKGRVGRVNLAPMFGRELHARQHVVGLQEQLTDKGKPRFQTCHTPVCLFLLGRRTELLL